MPILKIKFDDAVDAVETSIPLSVSSVPSTSVPSNASSVPLAKVNSSKKISKDELRNVILAICRNDFVTLRTMAEAMGRKQEYLRIKHLNFMVENRMLIAKYPDKPSHPYQAYKASY